MRRFISLTVRGQEDREFGHGFPGDWATNVQDDFRVLFFSGMLFNKMKMNRTFFSSS